MKLPAKWKEGYLRALQVPVLGRTVFGPVLRGIWKLIQFFHREPLRAQLPDGLISTYASTIDGLRRQVEALEHRTAALETELVQARESARVQSLLLSSAVQSLLQRAEGQDHAADFQRRAFASALSGLQRRSEALEQAQADLPLESN